MSPYRVAAAVASLETPPRSTLAKRAVAQLRALAKLLALAIIFAVFPVFWFPVLNGAMSALQERVLRKRPVRARAIAQHP